MRRRLWFATALLVVLAACGGASTSDKGASPPDEPTASSTTSATTPPAAAPQMRGNAATNPACKLLTLEQITTLTGLNVTGLLGLPTQGDAAKKAESCTWYLDSETIQASLVVQYTVYAKPPADLLAYYPTVVKQGLGKRVPKLGDYSKIDSAVLDTIDRRAEIHVTLRLHYPEATPEDQAATIAIMRLVMAGVPQ